MGGINRGEYIETQRQDWDRVASGWEKWDRWFDENLAFLNYRLVGDARIRPGQQILDLGSGTGYPAILAAQAVGDQGKVVGLDVAEEMVEAARRKAKALGVNAIFRAADVTTLPFEAGSFDAVISRFCLMFLPDIPKALGEIARVLRPGGYLAAAVWSAAEKNPYLRTPIDVIKRLIEIPAPQPDQPGLFRLARTGELLGIAEAAGLHRIADEELTGEVRFGSADEYLSSLLEIAAPVQSLFARLTPSQRHEAESEIKIAAGKFRKGSALALPIAARIVVARKPG